jgi:hypothetical protein
VVAAQKQNALTARAFVPGEAPHHRGAAVEIGPALEICDGDEELSTDRLEQVAEV